MVENKFTEKVVSCKCGAAGMTFERVVTGNGLYFIKIYCRSCGCCSPIKKSALAAVLSWNSHFGSRAKKETMTWIFGDSWSRFL